MTQKYDLYVACDCTFSTDNFKEAEREFYKATNEHPDSDIDVLSEDGETSFLAYDSDTGQVYDNRLKTGGK